MTLWSEPEGPWRMSTFLSSEGTDEGAQGLVQGHTVPEFGIQVVALGATPGPRAGPGAARGNTGHQTGLVGLSLCL